MTWLYLGCFSAFVMTLLWRMFNDEIAPQDSTEWLENTPISS